MMVRCVSCREEITNRADLVTDRILLVPRAYHNRCYGERMKGAGLLYLVARPLNTPWGTLEALLWAVAAVAASLLGASLWQVVGIAGGALALTIIPRAISYWRLERPLPALAPVASEDQETKLSPCAEDAPGTGVFCSECLEELRYRSELVVAMLPARSSIGAYCTECYGKLCKDTFGLNWNVPLNSVFQRLFTLAPLAIFGMALSWDPGPSVLQCLPILGIWALVSLPHLYSYLRYERRLPRKEA